MPYIPQDRRALIHIPGNAGELNWLLSRVCHQYIIEHGMKYQVMNDCMGALEGCKLELYRTVIAPYENAKKAMNGPVSELDA